MANRNQQANNQGTARLRRVRQSGNVSLQLGVMFTGVLLGLMGFAVDLGRLYMSRAELKTAANAIALAEAQRLIGTTGALATADAAGKVTYENQTNFGNRYDFGGLKDFARYGAALDPELSNLRITTIGVGFSLAGVSSLDLVYHRYRQVRPAKELRHARIEADLTGGHTGIGSGIDLVATMYPSPRIEFSTTISAFRAGPAFGVLAGRRYHYWALATKLLF